MRYNIPYEDATQALYDIARANSRRAIAEVQK